MEAAMRSATPRIAIAGGGAVTALGIGADRFEQAILANAIGLKRCPRLAGTPYESTVTGFVPEEAWDRIRKVNAIDEDARAFLLADAALREAELDLRRTRIGPDPGSRDAQPEGPERSFLDRISPQRRGLVLSTTKAEITALEKSLQQQPSSAMAQRHLFPALLAADLAEAHQITGPVQCVSVACISGLLAIQQGVLLIHEDKADLVLVAGVDLLSDFVLSGFTTLKSLEPGGCHPFDVDRKGLSLGEGAGAIALVRRETLNATALVVTGWGSSNDANHLTGPSRDGSGLALAIDRALKKSGKTPDAIDFVHTHGTGTRYNDSMEGMALRLVFGDSVPPFCSSKGVFGHTLGAAGLLETLICLAAARMQMLPGTPGLRTPDPSVPDSLVQTPRPAASLRHILKINAGFGGTNAALVLEWEGA